MNKSKQLEIARGKYLTFMTRSYQHYSRPGSNSCNIFNPHQAGGGGGGSYQAGGGGGSYQADGGGGGSYQAGGGGGSYQAGEGEDGVIQFL